MPDAPKPDRTPADHRHEAESLEKLAVTLREKADLAEAAAKLHRAMAEMEERGLTTDTEDAKVRRMSQPDLIAEMAKSRKIGRPIEGKHALHAALKRTGMTMSELARVLGANRNTVKSWVHQRIPAAMAKRIEDLLGVPATAKSWPAGIQQ